MGRTNSIEFLCEATIDARPTWMGSGMGPAAVLAFSTGGSAMLMV